MDSALALDTQVISVVKAGLSQLRIISKLKPIFFFKDLETVIHAFVSSHIDYCNSLYRHFSGSVISSCSGQASDSYKEEGLSPQFWSPFTGCL